MPVVRVRFFGPVRSIAGKKEQELEMSPGTTTKDLLEELRKVSNPEFSKYIVIQGNTVNPVLLMAINGEGLDEINNINAPLPDNPVLDIMLVSPIAGGETTVQT